MLELPTRDRKMTLDPQNALLKGGAVHSPRSRSATGCTPAAQAILRAIELGTELVCWRAQALY